MEFTMDMINENLCPEGEYKGYVWLAWTDDDGDEHYYPAAPDEALDKLNNDTGWYFAN